MITYTNLGKRGNLGNQLFQIAATIGIANKNHQDYCFPKWKYSIYFEKELPICNPDKKQYQTFKEKQFEYQNIVLNRGEYNLIGWFQSEKYFDIKQVKDQFRFKKYLVHSITNKYGFLLNSKHILISIRRGDFVNHPYYFQLSYKYYFLAIIENFPDWESRNLIFTSDDIDYCKRHYSFLKNSYFLDDLNAIEQLAFGSLATDFIISNSTFSWWLAWLGEKMNSIIIRPEKNFRGEYATINNDKDYFPSRWQTYKVGATINSKYLNLIIKGEFFRLIDNTNSFFQKKKKFSKKAIKRIIGYNW